MHVLLDHISSVIVATVLFLSLIVVVNRNRQNTVELQIGQVVEKQAASFSRTLERDLENIRTQEQTQIALGRPEECFIERDGNGNVVRLLFPTLERPDDGVASNIIHVEYRLIPEDTTTIAVNDSLMQVYRIERRRKVNDLTYIDDGGSGAIVTAFRVGMVADGAVAAPVGALIEVCPEALDRIQYELQAAIPTVAQQSADQHTTAGLNIARYGQTIFSYNR